MTYTTPPTTSITVTRLIPATPAAVYDVWIDPASAGGPWHGAARLVIDVRVDGLFYSSITHQGHDWAHYGRFQALERPQRVAHTWVSEGTRGLESVVTVTFAASGGGTLVTLVHSGVPDDAFGRQHADGWTWVLGCLHDRFAAAKPA